MPRPKDIAEKTRANVSLSQRPKDRRRPLAHVAAHLWGSQCAIAFYEDRTGKGLNYNLNIEVGSTLVLGRRLEILKDEPVKKLPSDLVGKIYDEVDFANTAAVADTLHRWCRDDLGLGPCLTCPG